MKNIEDTFLDLSLPVNSIAMFKRGIEILEEGETNSISSLDTRPDVKHKMRKLLWLLNSQMFGQMAIINMMDQWSEMRGKEWKKRSR